MNTWKHQLLAGWPWADGSDNDKLERTLVCQDAGLVKLDPTDVHSGQAASNHDRLFVLTATGRIVMREIEQALAQRKAAQQQQDGGQQQPGSKLFGKPSKGLPPAGSETLDPAKTAEQEQQ